MCRGLRVENLEISTIRYYNMHISLLFFAFHAHNNVSDNNIVCVFNKSGAYMCKI